MAEDQTWGPAYLADVEPPPDADSIKCNFCGTSLLDLYHDGRMGCADCYERFRPQVHRALLVLHGEYLHIGKKPYPG